MCQGILVLSTIKNGNHPQGLSGLFTCDLHVNRPDSTFTNYSLAPSCLLYVGKYLVTPSFAEEIPTLPLQSFLWLSNFKIKKKKKRGTHAYTFPSTHRWWWWWRHGEKPWITICISQTLSLNTSEKSSMSLHVPIQQFMCHRCWWQLALYLIHSPDYIPGSFSWINLFRTQNPSWSGYHRHRYLTNEETKAQWHCRPAQEHVTKRWQNQKKSRGVAPVHTLRHWATYKVPMTRPWNDHVEVHLSTTQTTPILIISTIPSFSQSIHTWLAKSVHSGF